MEKMALAAVAESVLSETLDSEKALLALDELIHPCNILSEMEERGKYGFGHLRFQEFLAAREMLENRSIDLLGLLERTWWRGAFILYARVSDGIAWLLKMTLESCDEDSTAIDTLRSMTLVRPEDEQSELRASLYVSRTYESWMDGEPE